MHRFLLATALLGATIVTANAQQAGGADGLRGALSGDTFDGGQADGQYDGRYLSGAISVADEPRAIDIDPQTQQPRPREAASVVEAATTGPVQPQGRVRPVTPIAPVTPVAPVTTGNIRASAGQSEDAFAGDTERDAPRGIRAGSFLIFPQLVVRGGATTNVDSTPSKKSGGFYRIAPTVKIKSDWERHSSETTLRGTFLGYPSEADNNELSLAATNTTRLDVGEQTSIDGTISYSLKPESSSDPETPAGGKTVYVHGAAGSLGITREVGMIAATLRGGLDGTFYSGGGARNNAVASATVRVGYTLKSSVSPFAEATVLRRVYEQSSRRDATGYAVRGGVAFDSGTKLRGELGVGWRAEYLDGKIYKPLQGLLVDGNIAWSPTRLTTVRMTASTAFEASSLTGASGSVEYAGAVAVSHSLTRDVALEVAGGAAYRTYRGLDLNELTLTGSATASYAVSDTAALQAQYSYERVDSSLAGEDYDSHAIEFGVRLRR